jgi:signal transduction histidine kinase
MKYFSAIYLLLLVYIIAALVWWGLSLNAQSGQIYDQQIITLHAQVDSLKEPTVFNARKKNLEIKRSARKSQYIGEGCAFLLVIFVGAAIVYNSFRRRILLSRQQNNFMLSVTHELKSPIAAMKLNLQTLAKYHLDEEKKNLLIDKCVMESNRLNDLCNNMLLASQMEGRQVKTTHEKLNFSELVDRSFTDYSLRYPERFDAQFSDEDVWVVGDQLMLQMSVNNLLENAVKYSPARSVITVQVFSKNNLATLQVKDEGVGIPDNEKAKIFQKFYRVGNENSRKTKGTGLGLYLTHRIISQHKGKIVVKDNQPKGSVFEISLPAT